MLFEPGMRATASIGRLAGGISMLSIIYRYIQCIRGCSRFGAGRASDDDLAVLQEELSINRQAPALAQIADEIPVDCRAIDAAGFWDAGADRHVDGAADLLIEEDTAGEVGNVEVRPD